MELDSYRYSIGAFWPGRQSVNSVYTEYGQKFGLGRNTLTKARDGELTKTSADTVISLLALCSVWAERDVEFDEILKKVE